MTADKAIEYLDIVLKAHPRLRPGDFGQSVKLGQEALAELVRLRKTIPILKDTLLPGEDPDDSAQSTFEHEAPNTIYHTAWAAKPTLLPGENPE